ncbi:MAG: hypothetical protein LBT40_00785 [Deltaproteobacteria bacterium]|jgi:hypothetical protein|nr:hypothetical protein [Deltaproteobacteria bacterium]
MPEVIKVDIGLVRSETARLKGLKRAYVRPDIPSGKLANALAGYAREADQGEVELLYDDTYLGSARSGFAITADRLFVDGPSGDPGSFDFRDVSGVIFKRNVLFVNGEPAKKFSTLSGSGAEAVQALVAAMADLYGNPLAISAKDDLAMSGLIRNSAGPFDPGRVLEKNRSRTEGLERLFVCPNIPDGLLGTAISTFAQGALASDSLFFYDNSEKGDGSVGLLCTGMSVYASRESDPPFSMDLSEIRNVTAAEGTLAINNIPVISPAREKAAANLRHIVYDLFLEWNGIEESYFGIMDVSRLRPELITPDNILCYGVFQRFDSENFPPYDLYRNNCGGINIFVNGPSNERMETPTLENTEGNLYLPTFYVNLAGHIIHKEQNLRPRIPFLMTQFILTLALRFQRIDMQPSCDAEEIVENSENVTLVTARFLTYLLADIMKRCGRTDFSEGCTFAALIYRAFACRYVFHLVERYLPPQDQMISRGDLELDRYFGMVGEPGMSGFQPRSGELVMSYRDLPAYDEHDLFVQDFVSAVAQAAGGAQYSGYALDDTAQGLDFLLSLSPFGPGHGINATAESSIVESAILARRPEISRSASKFFDIAQLNLRKFVEGLSEITDLITLLHIFESSPF